MILNLLRSIQTRFVRFGYVKRSLVSTKVLPQKAFTQESDDLTPQPGSPGQRSECRKISKEVLPTATARTVPMMLTNRENVVLSFDEIPGPKALKHLATIRNYLSDFGTQITAGILTVGLNIGTFIDKKTPLRSLSVLFDEYGPVVRFISPIGGDIVLVNNPDHIQKIYTMEGEYPVRSTLDSLEKYRLEHRNHAYGGLFSSQGKEWNRQRSVIYEPLQCSVFNHIQSLDDVCDVFTRKLYNIRNYQDEVTKDVTAEIHKWAFDSLGLILFSKRFTMLETDLVYSQCDMSWLYHSLGKATEAIMKCESGLHFWKMFTTPAWSSLVKHCDSLDNLIGKHVHEAEHSMTYQNSEITCKLSFAYRFPVKDNYFVDTFFKAGVVLFWFSYTYCLDLRRLRQRLYAKQKTILPASTSLINAMLLGDDKMSAEDISTIIMDMLLIGVNTITSSTSFLLYHLAKHTKVQKMLHQEICEVYPHTDKIDFKNVTKETPFLQACIKETLRLVPPIPVITRILPKNITIDKYNIPRGTLIIISNHDASLKESNYEDAKRFYPQRWLHADSKDYHTFASIPFGYGARKCMAQNIAETMMSMLIIRIMQKYKLEYHYGEIEPKKGAFIAIPNRPLKMRFIDRV